MAAISITAASVLPSSTATIDQGVAGATITQGQALYIDTSDSNKLKLADANGTAPANTFAGIAVNAASSGQKITYCSKDLGGFTVGGTVAVGDDVWLSGTAGGITKTRADLTTGDTVIHLGVINSSGKLILNPVAGGNVP
jgi:hypothetical protein